MKFLIYFCTIWTATLACHRKISDKVSAKLPAIPVCIQRKIDSIKQQPLSNPPTEINEYDYGERKVYLISANCCDFYSIAVDSSCNYVCAPSGGFTGKGDRKCADFSEKAKLVRLIWKDQREKK